MNTLAKQTNLSEPKDYVAKIEKRQMEWQWNRPLLFSALAFAMAASAGAFLSYRINTTKTSQTYFSRAQSAAESGDLAGQAKWLQRYLLIQTDDIEAVVTVAIAADDAAEAAVPERRFEAIDRARRLLSSSIGRLGTQDAEQVNELRGRLIKRLLQLGGAWYREAERQVIALAADVSDPKANRWMAEAIVGQVRAARYDARSAGKYDSKEDYWNWLAQQKPGEVLFNAIKLNPNEVGLIGSLVELFQESPNLFDQIEGNAPDRNAALAQRVEATFTGIAANTDSLSSWIRYRFEQQRGQVEKADQILLPAAEKAAARLTAAAAKSKRVKSDADIVDDANVPRESNVPIAKDSEDLSAEVVSESTGDQAADQTWDYILVSEAARRVVESEPALARAYYDQLTADRPDLVPPAVVENVYLASGQLALQENDEDLAVAIWEQGLAVFPKSLDLLGSLSRLQVFQLQAGVNSLDSPASEGLGASVETAQSRPDIAPATVTLNRFNDAIESSSTRLIQASESDLSREQKLVLARRLETARWRAHVLRAALASLNNRTREATVELQSAMASPAEVEDSERMAATLQLASLYQTEGMWDQVAMTFDEAIKRFPADVALRARAADAWARAGDQAQSLQQWRLAGAVNSLGIQVAAIEAQLNDQARLPSSQQDFSGLRVAIRNIRNQHADSIEMFSRKSVQRPNMYASNKPSDETSETDVRSLDDVTSQAIARLEIAAVLLPPTETDAEQYWQSTDFVTALTALAEKYRDDLVIQGFAAERFSQLNRTDLADQALDRLASLEGADSKAVAVVQARISSSQGDSLGAATSLISFAQTHQDASNSRDVDDIIQLAASYAIRAGQTEMAYQTLLKVPAERRSLSTDFLLARIAQELPPESSIFQQNDLANTPDQLSLYWEKQLQQREGESGSYWRSLQVTRLIDEMRGQAGSIKRDDPRLRQARQTLKELLTLRPRWGEAISLEGWLLSIEGQTERAVEFLRRGIAAGDRRMQTRTRLWQQLVMLGREAEVDEDIRVAAAASGQPVEQFASARIQLAMRQGDYQRSVDVARQAVERSPNDAAAQIVFARTAAMAATQPDLAQSRTELLQQAHQAIDAAAALEGTKEISVVSARMAVTLAEGDEAAIRAEAEKLKDSKLPEFERLMLVSQALVAIKDYEAALPILKQADEVRPSSRTQLGLALLYRELKRGEDEVAALRRAQQRDPDNAVLRNQLAQALVARDGAEIDWSEIEQLLQTSQGVTEVNRYLYAILLGTRGQSQQQEQAAKILQEIIQERNARSDDASRVLAAIRRRQLESILANQPEIKSDKRVAAVAEDATAEDATAEAAAGEDATVESSRSDNVSPAAARLGKEIRTIYDSLTTKSQPETIDLFRYADFLLQSGSEEDLGKVVEILERLKGLKQGALASLEISVRYAQKVGQQETTPEIVGQWAQRVTTSGAIDDSNVASIAGASLVKLGFVEDGLRWFQQAYDQNSEVLSNYVITLVQLGRNDEALQLSASHYDEHQDARSAILLAELLLSQPESQRNPDHQQRVETAVKEFHTNAPLLESVATLRIQQNDYAAAIDLYQRAHLIEPLRVRTLNNLAMAFSEVPGREAEGLSPIQQAINLAGEIPELLDTKGVVLLKARKAVEAEQVFRSAIEQQPDEPRFHFHLILALMQQGKESEAKRQWNELQLDKLDPAGLTAAERKTLDQMKQTYGT